MKRNKENKFAQKFQLLDSQEYSEDINWSMSSSNDEENCSSITFCNMTNRRRYTKRKRRKKIDNVGNLDITIINSTPAAVGNKSPILCDKSRTAVSPVLGSKLLQRSPILVSRSSQKRPVLQPNRGNVNRKLFKYDKSESFANDVSVYDNKNTVKNTSNFDLAEHSHNFSKEISSVSEKSSEINYKNDIYKSVKNFFESNFTSDNASQNSISDATTPKDSVLSDDIEISSSTTDYETSNIQNLNKPSPEKCHKETLKKVRYKKDGPAYRLNMLLKKQNASHSLWLHEKFLASNSNFVIPIVEHLIFRVKAIDSEYGCTILSAIDESDINYSIVINNVYVLEKIECDSIIKVYKPYKLVERGNHRVLLNVCKYDHLVMKLGET